tara:strand:+ start:172 stop:372 length:201 start_codon:yes stop_codon:yes gene_type:complete
VAQDGNANETMLGDNTYCGREETEESVVWRGRVQAGGDDLPGGESRVHDILARGVGENSSVAALIL